MTLNEVPPLCQNHSSIFVYEPILMKNFRMLISWRHIWPKMHFYFMEKFCYFFFTFGPSDLYTTLNYVLMDKFCPSFIYWVIFKKLIIFLFVYRNVGVVEFASYSDVKNVIEKLDGKELNGRAIRIIDTSTSKGRKQSRSR